MSKPNKNLERCRTKNNHSTIGHFSGYTALHYAVMAKDVERVRLLVGQKCDINAANGTGSTPLHLASDSEIARILLDGNTEKVNVNAVDNTGNSPLHVAVRGRHRETVRLLVLKNGRYDLLNASGKSPLSLAKDKDMKNILLHKEAAVTTISLLSPPVLSCTKRSKLAAKPTSIPDGPIVLPGRPELQSPSILKRKRHECVNGEDERTGSRLRFSDVNDYSGVEEMPPVEKRVRAAPLYTEPKFSSDDDE